jgi:hypothetical protein
MEIPIRSEALRQKFGADNMAVIEDEAAAGLAGKDKAGDAGDQQRITKAQQDGSHDGEENRGLPDGVHFVSPKNYPQGLKLVILLLHFGSPG